MTDREEADISKWIIAILVGIILIDYARSLNWG